MQQGNSIGGAIDHSSPHPGPAPDPAPDFSNLYQDCHQARAEFLSTINEYLAKNGQAPVAATPDAGWSDVRASVASACDALESLAGKDNEFKGFTGRLKKAYRKLCDNAELGASFISLIPNDQMYTAVLCGGLKVIFNALKNANLHRQAIFSALEQLPLLLDDRAASLEIYSEDEELHRRMAALYSSTVKAYQIILQYFIGSKVKVGLKHLLPNTNEKLKESIADVKLKSEQLKDRTMVLLQKRQQDMLERQTKSGIKQDLAFELTSQIRTTSAETRDDARRIRTMLECNELQGLFEKLKNFLNQQDIIKDTRQLATQRPQQAPGSLDVDEVLTMFEFDSQLVFTDCQKLINMRRNQNSLEDAKILYIIQSDELRAWLLQPHSTSLLVNGRSISQQKCETSFFAAKLFALLYATSNTDSTIIPLSFYCSQHRDERMDPVANPVELSMSLLLQLLDLYRHFKPSHLQRVRDHLNPRDLGNILELFQYLVSRLRRGTILFIILDGVSFFDEPAQRGAEMREVMSAMVSLTRNFSMKAATKAIFTSATRARDFEDLFALDKAEILNMPREAGLKGQYKESRWDRLTLPDIGAGAEKTTETV